MDKFTLLYTTMSGSIIAICAYLGIEHEVFFMYSILMGIDFVTGVLKAIARKDLSSKTAIQGFSSKFVLLLLILSIGVFGKVNDIDMTYILTLAFTTLSMAELYSITGNIYEIRTGKKVKEYDAISAIIEKLLDMIKDKLIKNIK